jgi:hypothetical protein
VRFVHAFGASMRLRTPNAMRAVAAVIAIVFIATVALLVDRCVAAETWSAHLSSAIAALQAMNATAAAATMVFAIFVAATCLGCPINLCIAACMLALAPMRGSPLLSWARSRARRSCMRSAA